MNRNGIGKWALLLVVFLIAGCVEEDRYKKAAEVAERASERQAEQNSEMARLNREVAEGTRRMVTADAEARKEIVEVHHELQAERAGLHEGFDALESERKDIAQSRRMESILVPVAKAAGVALVSVAVVGLCWVMVLGAHRSEASDAELSDLLIDDLTRQQPRLFISREAAPTIEHPPHTGQSNPPSLPRTDGPSSESTEGDMD